MVELFQLARERSVMTTSIDDIKNEIIQFSPGATEPIQIELFNKASNKTTKLINNVAPENMMKGRSQRYLFELKKPIFMSTIEVQTANYDSYKEMEFGWQTTAGSGESKKKVRLSGTSFTINISRIVSAFSFKPPSQFYPDTQIQGVIVHGLQMDEFDTICSRIGQLAKFKSDLDQKCEALATKAAENQAILDGFEDKKTNLTNETATLVSAKSDAARDAENAQGVLTDIEAKITAKKTELTDVSGQVKEQEDQVDQKQKASTVLNTEIAESTRKLKSLKDDINLFPSEISGYIAQGSENIKRYMEVGFVPILIIIVVLYVLFSNAVNLTVVYEKLEGIDLWTMVLSRVPFAIISIFIVHACYKLARVFIRESIRISQQRLDLSKVSIVARDVSNASAAGLVITPDELYELNTKLKMDMLKSHLKGYVQEDYEYDLEIGIWEKWLTVAKQRLSQKVS